MDACEALAPEIEDVDAGVEPDGHLLVTGFKKSHSRNHRFKGFAEKLRQRIETKYRQEIGGIPEEEKEIGCTPKDKKEIGCIPEDVGIPINNMYHSNKQYVPVDIASRWRFPVLGVGSFYQVMRKPMIIVIIYI